MVIIVLLMLKKEDIEMIRWERLVGLLVIVVALSVLMVYTTDTVVKNLTLGLDLQGGFEVLYQAETPNGEAVTSQALKDTVSIIQKRISGIGVKEPSIDIEGKDRIRVKLAGVANQDEARKLLGKPARLTFRNAKGDILLDGNDIKSGSAKVGYDNLQRPAVDIEFKDPTKFRDITQQYLGQPIGIFLDETSIQTPNVSVVISSGKAQITGQESVAKAKELADLLNAGALPLNLKEIQSQSVGASLGMQALSLTVKAGIIGSIIVLLFMLLFYRIPGVIANFSLIVYVYIILLLFWQMHVTLTLPGIAALVLGIGMAVDANIITYERIKEELRSGKTLLSSIRAGSRRSLATILDANITTIIAAVVLFIFGTGPIQGFAITLIVSIIVSMFTAVFGARYLLNLFVKSNLVTKPWGYGVKEEEIGEL